MTEVIRTQKLTHIYSPGTPFARTALDQVDLSVKQGEFIAIIGHTGSGKSTLVQHLNGLFRPTSGQVFVNGRDIWAEPKKIRQVRFEVGLVFQYPEYQLFEETVAADIAFGPKNMGLEGEALSRRVAEAAAAAGVAPELMEKSPFELSGGQKRRVAIAGVLAMEPSVLVLDEPAAGLDPRGQREIMDTIVAYQKKKNSTVLLVTHSMEEAARVAGRILVLKEGAIMLDGTPQEVFARAQELSLAGLDVPVITRVFLRLRAAGLPVDPTIYSAGQAADALLRLKKGETV